MLKVEPVLIICDWCGISFSRRQSDIKGKSQFCSQECRLKWHSKTMTEKNSFRWRNGNKLCVGCNEYLSIDNFHKDKNKKSGLSSICKKCKSKRSKGRVREFKLERTYGTYKYTAKVKGLSFDIPIDEFATLLYADCYYCGEFPNEVNGIDRVDNTLGYVSDNYVPCCKRCNYIKKAMSQKEFAEFILSTYDWAKQFEGD